MGLTSVRRMLATTAPPMRRQRDACNGSVTPPAPAILLRHCHCSDCLNFSNAAGEYFCSEYIGGTAIVWATGERFCDPTPDAWHYCARYRGPQVSKDVWVWPKAPVRLKKWPAPSGGGLGSGPNTSRLAGGEPAGNNSHYTESVQNTPALPPVPAARVAPQAAQVGAGSNIPAKPDNPTANPGKRDVARPRVNGSFPRTYGGDRGGNSRAPVLCLFDRRT